MFKQFLKKLTSIKTLALIFCCFLLSYIVISGKTEFLEIAKILAYAPLSYFIVNVTQDFIFKNKSTDEGR